MEKLKAWIVFSSLLLLGAVACSTAATSTPAVPTEVPCPTCPPPVPGPTISPTQIPTPTAAPEPRVLTICLGAEPDTLFFYQSSMLAANSVLEAIYDGPIDPLGYSYQPVILEKLPSLADGDARIMPVPVQSGDKVVADDGEVVILAEGQLVRPYGCNQSDCAVVFDGGMIEMNQLSADFTLLEDLHWEDGEALTTADTLFSFKVGQQCESNLDWCDNNSLVDRTADYIALDEYTTRWIGLPGNMDPHYMTNFFHPLPEHQLADMGVHEMKEAEKAARQPMGWGPYRIDSWDIGREIRLYKNPFYFKAEEGLPRFDELVFKFTGQYSPQNIGKLLAGECDLVDQNAMLEDVLLLLVALDQQGLLQTHTVSGPVWEHFDFSLLHADYDDGFQLGRDRPDLFGDLRTRQAVARCLDRESVIKQVVYGMSDSDYQNLYPGGPIDVSSFGSSEASNAYIPVDHPLYNPGIPAYPFSPDEANALLEEVGWIDHDDDASTPRQANSIPNVPDGTLFEFDYLTTSSAQRKQTAQILIDSLSKCGIKVNTQHVDAVEFYELPGSPVFSRNFDVAEFAWLTGEIPTCELFLTENIPGDPEELNPDGAPRFPRGWEGENNSGYSSIEFDRACRAAAAALPGQQGFVEHHMLAQEIFTRDLPVIPLFQRLKVTAARADMCGYEMDATAISDTWNIEAFGLGDECEN